MISYLESAVNLYLVVRILKNNQLIDLCQCSLNPSGNTLSHPFRSFWLKALEFELIS